MRYINLYTKYIIFINRKVVKILASGVRYTYDEAKIIVQRLGYILLSKEYINAKTKLDIIDSEGFKYSITLDNLLSNKKPDIVSSYNPHSIDNIKHFLMLNNSKSVLMTEKYINKDQLLDFKCICDNEYKAKVDKVINRNKLKCNECSVKERGFNHRIPFDTVVSKFNERGLTPLFNNYNSCYERLLCENELGYIGLLSYHKLSNGDLFDIVSKHNPYSIENIKNFIILNNLTCKLESIKYLNAKEDLSFKCECGDTYKTSWRVFMTYMNDRCPKCSSMQSGYARILEDYLKENKFSYDKEFTFSDCRDKKVLRFDFIVYIDDNFVLIEVDGETHFIPSWQGEKGLKEQQRRDEIKNNYCKNNKIRLIRISYVEFNNVSYKNKLQKELYKNVS
ncbi:MAG: hypothetical protein PHY08_13130 [Candidatus Cloacimonetes bacterium]|nr:hypothetical protein [Candidatus Cloacimonadota bacterium]